MITCAYVGPAGATASRCRFDGVSRAAVLTMLLAIRSVDDHSSWWKGSWAFNRATNRHQHTRIQPLQSIGMQRLSDGWWLEI